MSFYYSSFSTQKKVILCLIKKENIFERFCKDIYTIKYQNCDFSHMHVFIFVNTTDIFLITSHIDEIICAKLLTI